MQLTKKLEKKKEDMYRNTQQIVQDVKDAAEEGAEKLKEEVKEVVEDAVDAVCPKMERIVSTMNRQYSAFHSLGEEIKCVWKHGHWGWVRSILGTNLLQPVDDDGEWAFIRGCFREWRFGPLIQLFMLSFGSLMFPPLGFFLLAYLWERSYITEIGTREAVVRTARARERWVFVNGMCVDNNLGHANATQLSKLFNRQVGFFHNPTQGLLFDFIECMVGRTFNVQTPVSRSLTACLTKSLQNPTFDKVVLVCHSQGGIIASNAIELLINRNVQIKNLEVYTFGSAADEFMQVQDEETKLSYPYYEHFANEHDYVAQIGIFHWHVPGNVYSAPKIGHFFGDHYLPTFRQRQYQLYCGSSNIPSKLYHYLDRANEEKAEAEKPLKKEKPEQPSYPTLPRPFFDPFSMLSASIAASIQPSPQKARLHSPPNISPPLSPIPLSPFSQASFSYSPFLSPSPSPSPITSPPTHLSPVPPSPPTKVHATPENKYVAQMPQM